jgi:uncharacterized protein YpuA (DUF1002 family)
MPKTERDYIMTLENPTAFQRLVNRSEVQRMVDELNNLHKLVPEDTEPEEIQQWEIALSFKTVDIPHLLEELKEVRDTRE